MNVLIIANARYKGGLSGGDAIYESFKRYWPCEFTEINMLNIDFKPFSVCYVFRIALSIFRALLDNRRFDVVYSASDFLSDSIPGFIYKAKGNRWVAGFFLCAPKDNLAYLLTQKFAKWLIKFSDMVIVTNPTMYHLFPNNKKTWINGGIDLSLAGLSDKPKIYDAVFCGRIHPTKGIDELLEIWDLVREKKPKARLALIGDGDLGVDYVKHKLFAKHGLNQYNGITLFGYMGNERYEVYKQSKVVLYPTPLKYDHFSMAPVEAMACGCPMLNFNTPVNKVMSTYGSFGADTTEGFAENILWLLGSDQSRDNLGLSAIEFSKKFNYMNQSLRVYEDVKKELMCVS